MKDVLVNGIMLFVEKLEFLRNNKFYSSKLDWVKIGLCKILFNVLNANKIFIKAILIWTGWDAQGVTMEIFVSVVVKNGRAVMITTYVEIKDV